MVRRVERAYTETTVNQAKRFRVALQPMLYVEKESQLIQRSVHLFDYSISSNPLRFKRNRVIHSSCLDVNGQLAGTEPYIQIALF